MDMAVTLPILSPISYFSSTKGDNKNNSDVMHFIDSESNSNKNHQAGGRQLMYERDIVEEVNFVNPTAKSFILNRASFAAEQKRAA